MFTNFDLLESTGKALVAEGFERDRASAICTKLAQGQYKKSGDTLFILSNGKIIERLTSPALQTWLERAPELA